MARVVLDHITKKYDDTLAVDDLNIDVRDKEFLVLVGPSGCGKSTALRMIAGLEEITSGELSIGDRVVNEVAPKDRDIAMVFQSYALYPHMTVYDNMAFGLRLRKNIPGIDIPATSSNGHSADNAHSTGNGSGKPAEGSSLNVMAGRRQREALIRQRVERTASGLGLTDYLNRKPGQLSGGQRQRVALGRAIVRQPHVFLMDEPLSNLDAKMRISTRAELQKLHRSLGVTTIYVTHDQIEAMTMGDRIAVMKEGVLQQLDTPEAIYARPVNAFVATFIGSPSMNLFRVQLESTEGEVFAKGPGFRLRVPAALVQRLPSAGGEILIGLRPEMITDARFTPDADPSTVIQASIDTIENLGRDYLVYMTAGGQSFVARVDDRSDPRPGSEMKVAFDTSRMHMFDAITERSLL